MPDQRKFRSGIGTLENPLDQERHQIEVKDPFFLAIRQVAVGAVEIAEGGGLDHHQPDGAEPMQSGRSTCGFETAHQFTKPPPPLPQAPPPLRQPPLPQVRRLLLHLLPPFPFFHFPEP